MIHIVCRWIHLVLISLWWCQIRSWRFSLVWVWLTVVIVLCLVPLRTVWVLVAVDKNSFFG